MSFIIIKIRNPCDCNIEPIQILHWNSNTLLWTIPKQVEQYKQNQKEKTGGTSPKEGSVVCTKILFETVTHCSNIIWGHSVCRQETKEKQQHELQTNFTSHWWNDLQLQKDLSVLCFICQSISIIYSSFYGNSILVYDV